MFEQIHPDVVRGVHDAHRRSLRAAVRSRPTDRRRRRPAPRPHGDR